MFKTIAAMLVALGLSITPVTAEPLTNREAAEKLSASVVKLTRGWNFTFCTASKIGPSTFLSAGHCASGVNDDTKIINEQGDSSTTQWVKSVTVTTQGKKDDRSEDWMILHATTEEKSLTTLMLGCEDEIYLGMPVAYAGYPAPVDFAFSVGHVLSMNKVTSSYNNLDFVVDVQAAPGASGSPIVNMDTGNIIGVLTEGVMSRRTGVFGVGVEHIAGLDLCDDFFKEDIEVVPADTF